MTRITLSWSGAELWIPDSWTLWTVENVRFRRAGKVSAHIEIEVQPDDWQPIRAGLVQDGFAMPVGVVA